MRTRETQWQDKFTWGPGPWQHEPDKQQWPDPVTGLPCLMLRKEEMGHWCGYVGLEPGHPLYGIPYNRCALSPTTCDPERSCDHSPEALLSVHGGLTFSGMCQEDPHGICHVAEPGEADTLWWLGFDCTHSGDLAPGMEATLRRIGFARNPLVASQLAYLGTQDVYRDVRYVMRECQRLARQLHGGVGMGDG
jgi:hypothetical protein